MCNYTHERSNLPVKFQNYDSQIQAMENMFPYFYPRKQHRVFDPVNVTKKLERPDKQSGNFTAQSWPLNLTFRD